MATKAKKKPSSSGSSNKSSTPKSPKTKGTKKGKGKKKSTTKKAETPETDVVKVPEITYYEELVNSGNPETIRKANRIKEGIYYWK